MLNGMIALFIVRSMTALGATGLFEGDLGVEPLVPSRQGEGPEILWLCFMSYLPSEPTVATARLSDIGGELLRQVILGARVSFIERGIVAARRHSGSQVGHAGT